MRRVFLVLAFCGSCVFAEGANAQLFATAVTCLTDDEVSADERSLYERPALRFVEGLVSGLHPRYTGAYELLNAEAKAALKPDDFDRLGQQLSEHGIAIVSLNVNHSYRVASRSVGSAQTQFVQCTAIARGNVARPEERVMVAARPVPLQAHVVVQGKGLINSWGFTIWLMPEQGDWRVRHFHAVPITMADKSAQDLRTMARDEAALGHPFNALVLYRAAALLTYRGEAFHLGIGPEIRKELAALRPPASLQGKPPHLWKSGGREFRVLAILPTGVGTKLVLVVRHQLSNWGNKDDMERENRALLDALSAMHPEHAEIFDAVNVQGVQPGGTQIHGTVAEKKPRK